MNPTHIKEASLEDLDFLLSLEKDAFPQHWQSSQRSLRTSITSPHQQIFLLEIPSTEPNRAISVGAISVIHYKQSLRIFSLAIHSSYRRQGWGELLLRHVIDLASLRGFEKISLEADSRNKALVAWYEKFGFTIKKKLDDYYGQNEPAFRMTKEIQNMPFSLAPNDNIIVVDNAKKDDFQLADVDVISANDYLSQEPFKNSDRYHILNLCNSYKTHSLGYYVSLLASARNQRVVPSVMTIKDISNLSIAQSLIDEIREFIHLKLNGITENTFELTVILGKSPKAEFNDLSKKLFALFEIPFFSIQLINTLGEWSVKRLNLLNLSTIAKSHPKELNEAISRYFQKKRHRRTRLKQYKYDLAILMDRDEKTPPSCPVALEKFRKAGEQVGFYVEFISKIDYRRICEFDALFIRETTAIENHTYKFARHAYTEGLVVMDDPWSILRCSNKIYLHERLAKARIKQPHSWPLTKRSLQPDQRPVLNFPLVLKLPESSFSLGVYRVNNEDELNEKLALMFRQSDLVIAQEFLESTFDWRVGILDQTPLFACKYYMANGHWQIYNWTESNPSDIVGNSEAIPINQVPTHILNAAIKSSALIGDGLYGVDLKEINGQAYVIEINDNPNIDDGVEDILLGDELYLRVMTSFYNRIERERYQARYIL